VDGGGVKLARAYGSSIWNIVFWVILLQMMNMLYFDGGTFYYPVSLVMCIVFFITLLLHDLYDRGAIRWVIYGMGFGGILVAVLFMLGVGVSINPNSGRLEMFGENPNVMGIYMGISSIVVLNEFILRDVFRLRAGRYVLFGTYVPMVYLILETGSRTAFLIFAASLIVTVGLLPAKTKLLKVLLFFGGVIILFFLGKWFLDSDISVLRRLTETVESNDTSGRDELILGYMPTILTHPLGVGQTGAVEISRKVFGGTHVFLGIESCYSPHNVIVEILLYTGVLGLVLWGMFWANVSRCAWRAFKDEKNLTPILLLLPVAAVILSAQVLTEKWAYIIYAYILSAGHSPSAIPLRKRTLLRQISCVRDGRCYSSSHGSKGR